ncbi:MAG: hypothetical protein KKD07_02700 [Candidatus Omnitrophica bacterium]|nr:hypothetical protein [Candidatus Omnitrophota bacterium]MBU1997295.1 hypothetical protein [Candidatus Omnitrophota bacterium]MBU4333331.1 hypothetical protein [Candidatus Omnitrophota bacterium]
MRKKDFISGLTPCNGFVFSPVLLDGISNSFSLCMILALLFFVMYLSYVGTTKEKVFLVGLVYFISFARMNYLVAMGSFDILYSFVDVERIIRIAYLVVAFGLIAVGLSMFFKWAIFKRQVSADKIALRLPAFLREQTVLEGRKKTFFVDILLGLLLFVFVPFAIGHTVGLLSLGSAQSVELGYSFLAVVRVESLKFSYFKLFLYFISYMLPLIVVWFFIMFSMQNKSVVNNLKTHFSLMFMIFSAALLSVGVSCVLLVFNKLL